MLLISILMLLGWNIFGDAISGVPIITPNEVTRLMNQNDAQVLDIRKESQFEDGHIINAMNISLEHLAHHHNKLKRHQVNGVIFCCDTGSVSPKEARKLMNEGYEKVYCLKGGFQAWKTAGLPVTKGKK